MTHAIDTLRAEYDRRRYSHRVSHCMGGEHCSGCAGVRYARMKLDAAVCAEAEQRTTTRVHGCSQCGEDYSLTPRECGQCALDVVDNVQRAHGLSHCYDHRACVESTTPNGCNEYGFADNH